MGSQLTKNYEVDREPSASGGIGGLWKIYSAYKRDRARTPVSIFMFDKRLIDKRRTDRDEIINRLKVEAQALTRLRHPNILHIIEPPLEDNKTLAFVTERVDACIGDLLKKPNVLSQTLSDLETRLGCLDIVQAMTFLHAEARIVHFSLCPENIYITGSGKWRLGGLGFASTIGNELFADLPQGLDIAAAGRGSRYEQGGIQIPTPKFQYSAPEVVTDKKGYPSSDFFSLGCSLFSIYKALSGTQGEPYLLNPDDFTASAHRQACMNIERMHSTALSVLPENLRDIIGRMVVLNPGGRPGSHEVTVDKSFQDMFIKTIFYLENIQEKQESQKVHFLKGLSKIINQFDPIIMKKRILPALAYLMQHDALNPFVLPSLISVMKNSTVSQDFFINNLWPSISRLATGKEIPAQSMYVMLNDFELFMKYLNQDQFKKVLMPLMFKGMECGVPQIQEVCMGKCAEIAKSSDDIQWIRVQLLPRFLQGILNARAASVREAGLKTLGEIFSQFDRSTMVDTILPTLDKLKKQDVTGTITMYLLKVYEGIGKLLGHRVLALNILPALFPLMIEGELSGEQFIEFSDAIERMVKHVRDKRASEISVSDEIQVPEANVGAHQEVDNVFQDIFGGKKEEKHTEDPFTGDTGMFNFDQQPSPVQKQEPLPFKPEPVPQFKPEPVPQKLESTDVFAQFSQSAPPPKLQPPDQPRQQKSNLDPFTAFTSSKPAQYVNEDPFAQFNTGGSGSAKSNTSEQFQFTSPQPVQQTKISIPPPTQQNPKPVLMHPPPSQPMYQPPQEPKRYNLTTGYQLPPPQQKNDIFSAPQTTQQPVFDIFGSPPAQNTYQQPQYPSYSMGNSAQYSSGPQTPSQQFDVFGSGQQPAPSLNLPIGSPDDPFAGLDTPQYTPQNPTYPFNNNMFQSQFRPSSI